MWELKTARELKPGRTFVAVGEHLASARKITSDVPTVTGDTVALTARNRFSRVPADQPVTLAPDQPVYILTCTCNGMSFICNRWTFTGQCSCVHIPLPATTRTER